MKCRPKKKRSDTQPKMDGGKSDSYMQNQELKPIYAAETSHCIEKPTYSAQYQSPKMNNSCECEPKPLYYATPKNVDTVSGSANIQQPYSCGNMPPAGAPCMPNDDLWNLQFCRWWGWNWIRKREEEIMNRQRELLENQRKTQSRPKRSRSRSRKRRRRHKKDDFFTWCGKLCNGGRRQSQIKIEEKKQLKQLYDTPCSSVICPCGMKDREDRSLHLVGEYECSSSSARRICTPVSIMRNKTRRQECKYNVRKHQSWVCERTESSSSDECCPCVSSCPRRTSGSSTEESIEYLTLRMARIKSDCDDEECRCGKRTVVKYRSKSPCCEKSLPASCRKPPPCKYSSPARIPRFRRCVQPCRFEQTCGCRKHVHPCEYQTPKCFPKRAKHTKNYCQKNRKTTEHVVCCPCQQKTKTEYVVHYPCQQRTRREYEVCCPCQKARKKYVLCCSCEQPSIKLCCKKVKYGNTQRIVSPKNSNMSRDDVSCRENCGITKETADKCVGGSFITTDNCNDQQPNMAGDEFPAKEVICNTMQHSVSKALDAGTYVSPASGRLYSLRPKIFATNSVPHKSHLTQLLNIDEKLLAYNTDRSCLEKADEEHKFLLTAVCKAILSSRLSDKGSNIKEPHNYSPLDKNPTSLCDYANDDNRLPNLKTNVQISSDDSIYESKVKMKSDETNVPFKLLSSDMPSNNKKVASPALQLKTKQPNVINSILQKLRLPKKKYMLLENSLIQGNDSNRNVSDTSSETSVRKHPHVNNTSFCSSNYNPQTPSRESFVRKRENINMPKSVFSYSSPICTNSETYTKATLNLPGEAAKPNSIFLNTSVNIQQKNKNSNLLDACVPDLFSVGNKRAERSTFSGHLQRNIFGENYKQHLYNVFFSTIYPNCSNKCPSYSNNSHPENSSPSSNEQTQTNELRFSIHNCKCSKKYFANFKNNKYSCLTTDAQASTSKHTETDNKVTACNANAETQSSFINMSNKSVNNPSIPFPDTSKATQIYSVDDIKPPNILITTQPQPLLGEIKSSSSENELHCVNLNRGGAFHPFLSVPNSITATTCYIKNAQPLTERKLNIAANQSENELLCVNLNNENTPVPKSIKTGELSERKRTVENISYDRSENELLCLNLTKGTNYDFNCPPLFKQSISDKMSYALINDPSNSLNELKDEPKGIDLQAKEELTHCSLPRNIDSLKNVESELLITVNPTSNQNDIHFIAKNLQSYTSISDTSSFKTLLKQPSILCESTPIINESEESSTSVVTVAQPKVENFMTDSSTSALHLPPITKTYINSAVSPIKFEYTKRKFNDVEQADNIKRKIRKHESPFSMFCTPVPSKYVRASLHDSNTSLSRPERNMIVKKPSRLKVREKKWRY